MSQIYNVLLLFLTLSLPNKLIVAKNTLPLQDEETIKLYSRVKMWRVNIRDQTAHYVQLNLAQHRPQNLPVSSSVRKELINLTV